MPLRCERHWANVVISSISNRSNECFLFLPCVTCVVLNVGDKRRMEYLDTKLFLVLKSVNKFLSAQIPRYIITLHELLAHTPHDHVERRSLQHARAQLEELSRQMHDEVNTFCLMTHHIILNNLQISKYTGKSRKIFI